MRYIILLLPVLMACGGGQDQCSNVPQGIDQNVPGILVIGDSISIGYTPYVAEQVKTAQVTHTICNAESSSNGHAYIDKWLSYRKHWAIVTINHGYWDIPPNSQSVSPNVYAENLRIEVTKAKAVADTVIFITTTSVIQAWTNEHPGFNNVLVQEYNAAALIVTTELNIPVVDLYTVSLSIPDRDPSLLHFNSSGYSILGNTVYNGMITYGGIQ